MGAQNGKDQQSGATTTASGIQGEEMKEEINDKNDSEDTLIDEDEFEEGACATAPQLSLKANELKLEVSSIAARL